MRKALLGIIGTMAITGFCEQKEPLQTSYPQSWRQDAVAPPGAERSRYYQLVDSADNQLAAGNWIAAELLIRQALSLEPAHPGNTMLFSNLGVAELQQGKYKEAVYSFDLALIRARSSTIHTNRAKAYLGLGQPDAALRDLDAALEIDSLSQWALQTRALMRLSAGDVMQTDGAPARINSPATDREEVGRSACWADDFSRLRRHYPDNSWGWFGGGCAAESRDELDEAERCWQKALELEAAKSDAEERDVESEAAFRLVMLRLRRERLTEAGALLREQLKRHPRDGKLMAALGWYHRANLLREESEADLHLAREYGAPVALIDWIRAR